MTNPILDENLKQLFHHSTAQPNPDAVNRALARVEGRNQSPSRQGRIFVAAAAAVLVALLGWIVVPRTTPPQPAAQEDVARLIADLGSATPEVREKAKKSLLAMGPAALAPLDKALYHEDPEVRIQAQALAKIVRRAADIHPAVSFVRAAIKIVRARWTARDFDDFEKMAREAFDPVEPSHVHYVPKKTVDPVFDTRRDPELSLNAQINTWPGARDTLTPEMVDALNRDGGMIFVKFPQTLADLSPFCIFTLPDKVGWSAYVVVCLPEIEDLDPILGRFGLSTDDLASFVQSLQIVGGLKIADFDAKNPMAKAFRKGDLLKAVNGVPATGGQDLLQLFQPKDRTSTVTLDRSGKVFTAEFHRVYPGVIRKSEKK